jgi:hypothetical protein
MVAVRDYGQPLVDDEARLDDVDTVGLDETAFLAATELAGTRFGTGIVALNAVLSLREGSSVTSSTRRGRSSAKSTRRAPTPSQILQGSAWTRRTACRWAKRR